MIEGGWPFVTAAYVISTGAIAVLTLAVVLSARRWAKEAEKLDKQ